MRIRFSSFFVVYTAAIVGLSLVPQEIYLGISLRSFGSVIDDIFGILVFYGVLPCGVLFCLIPVFCKSTRESLVIGAVGLPLQAAGESLSTYVRNQSVGHYATPVVTVGTHFLVTLIASTVLFLVIVSLSTARSRALA
jgi:hypothetical protein